MTNKKESFKPYYKWNTFNTCCRVCIWIQIRSFKPYYKWNTFNTTDAKPLIDILENIEVLNLIINGIPSILNSSRYKLRSSFGFKPYYKWNTFNT